MNQSKNETSKIDESKVKGKKKKKAAKATDNFKDEFLSAINRIRANPAEFANKIMEAIVNIHPDGEKIIFDANGTKVSLVRGEEAFKEVAQILSEMPPSAPLEYTEELVIPIPEDQKDWKNNTLISQLLAKKKAEVISKYPECVFNMDLGVSDPEMSALLQVVDDSPFKGKRRDNLLNPNNRFVGISYVSKPKNKFCCYLTFSK